MNVVENISSETRVWPGLQTAGVTLELEPGQTAEVELPGGFTDPHLKVTKAKASKPEAGTAKTPEKSAPASTVPKGAL